MKNYDFLKYYYKMMYWTGTGNFWYENEIGNDNTRRYKICHSTLIIFFVIMTMFEISAATFGDFPEEEKNDSLILSIGHSMILIKIYFLLVNKEHIRELNKEIVDICNSYEDSKLMKRKHSNIKNNIYAYFFIIYGCVLCYILEGIWKLFSGSHFVTVITYYPAHENDSIPATLTRVFTTILLAIMLLWMVLCIDTHAMTHLLVYKYKFITLRQYFDNSGIEFQRLDDAGEKDLAQEYLADALVEGIKMHSKLIKILENIDKSFGTLIAIQVCLTMASAVPLLVQFALGSDLNLMGKMKILFFLTSLYFIIGVVLCNAGEITHEAALVADSLFYSSWYLCPTRVRTSPGRNIRKLILLAITQAQQPLVMKAFNMLDLTYGTFLAVVRSSYSLYTLIVSSV